MDRTQKTGRSARRAGGLQPEPARMSMIAPSLAEVMAERVAERTGRRVRNLTVEIQPGRGNRVILRGHTTSYHVKQLAQQAVREAFPDAQLENTIVVV